MSKRNIRDWGVTVAGLVIALGNAYINIKWSEFSIKTDWPMLVTSGVIAAAGYYLQIRGKDVKTPK